MMKAEAIQVYSPHTAVDAAPGGLGDWLADIVTGEPALAPEHGGEDANGAPPEAKTSASEQPTKKPAAQGDDAFLDVKRPVFMLQHHPSQMDVKDGDLKL